MYMFVHGRGELYLSHMLFFSPLTHSDCQLCSLICVCMHHTHKRVQCGYTLVSTTAQTLALWSRVCMRHVWAKGPSVLVFWFHLLPVHTRADWVLPICVFFPPDCLLFETANYCVTMMFAIKEMCAGGEDWKRQKAKMCMYEVGHHNFLLMYQNNW